MLDCLVVLADKVQCFVSLITFVSHIFLFLVSFDVVSRALIGNVFFTHYPSFFCVFFKTGECRSIGEYRGEYRF